MARQPSKKLTEETTEEVKENITGLAILREEYRTRKMPERKLVALRAKLVALFMSEEITEKEQDLMELILRTDRNAGKIHDAHHYMLNKIEVERVDGVCVVKTDDAPIVHHLYKNLECKYYYDHEYDDKKLKPDSIGRYQVYVPRVIPTDHQLSMATARKELKGHPTTPEDYELPKTVIHRVTLKPREFNAWFEIEESDILKPEATKEVEYTF